MESRGCREHQRTSENAWDEILRNSISPLGPNPEVHAENFPYIRQRKTIVGLQQKMSRAGFLRIGRVEVGNEFISMLEFCGGEPR